MIAPKMPSRTQDHTTSALVLSQLRRHFRCSHADQTTGPSTDSGLGLRHEVDQLLDAADKCRLEVVPVPHPTTDPLPRPRNVGLLGVRPPHGLAHAFLPVHA